LVSAVNGDAKRVIQHIPLSEQGFRVAWEILVERYEIERLIINTHIDNILKLPCLTCENSSQVRHLVNTTKCNLEALKAMKQDTELGHDHYLYCSTKTRCQNKKNGSFTFLTKNCQIYSSYTPSWNTDAMHWKA